MKKIETWLPGFPGFYNTVFDPENLIEQQLDVLNKKRTEPISRCFLQFDNEAYEKTVVTLFKGIVEEYFNSKGLNLSITIQAIKHPSSYNYYNDSVDVEIEVDVCKLVKMIYSDEQFIADQIKTRYKRHSGFIPYYSNKFEDWEEDTDHFTQFKDPHQLGAVLDMLFDVEMDDVYEQVLEQINITKFIPHYETLKDDVYCPKCDADLVIYSWRKEYWTVVDEFVAKWRNTQKKPVPELYSIDQWIKKVNPQYCYQCSKKK